MHSIEKEKNNIKIKEISPNSLFIIYIESVRVTG